VRSRLAVVVKNEGRSVRRRCVGHPDDASPVEAATGTSRDERISMAKLIYSAITCLDGYVAVGSANFDWAAPDKEVHSFVNDLQRSVGSTGGECMR